jgi:hypothetical protein
VDAIGSDADAEGKGRRSSFGREETHKDSEENMLAEAPPAKHCVEFEWTLERQIAQRTWGRIRQLHVDATPDRVVVTGSAPSYYLKQLALLAVKEVLAAVTVHPTVTLDIQITS